MMLAKELFIGWRTIYPHGLIIERRQVAFSSIPSFRKYETSTVAIITNGVFQTSHQHDKLPGHLSSEMCV